MFPCDEEGYYCTDKDSHYDETWRAMETLVDKGKTKTIGLSNFNRAQVQEILNLPNLKYKPAVLQDESHPYLQEKDLRDFCRLNGIAFQVK
jgi:diketogulonate reductase-like aldo/keto reductase